MRESGLFTKDQLRDVNEARMWAVWKLGFLLAKIKRGTGPGRQHCLDAVLGGVSAGKAKAFLSQSTPFRAFIS